MKSKVLKLIAVCVLCLTMIIGAIYLIEYLTN